MLVLTTVFDSIVSGDCAVELRGKKIDTAIMMNRKRKVVRTDEIILSLNSNNYTISENTNIV